MGKILKINRNLLTAVLSVTFLALVLRLIGINKPDGLWYDEITTYNDAISSSIIDVIRNSSSRPLYYVILHYWVQFLGNSDLVLRVLSVIFGVINVPVMYFTGLELEKYIKKAELDTPVSIVGLISALLVATNSFLIYYSQEIRQYSLLALVSTLSAWVVLKIINRPSWLNYGLFLGINAVFLITHYISTLIIIPEVIFISFYLFKKDKTELKRFLTLIAGFSIPCLLIFTLLVKIFTRTMVHSPNVIINTYSGVFNFDPQSIFVIVQDWFTPVLVGIYNNPENYLSFLLQNMDILRVIFIIIPVFISIWLILKGKKILLIFPLCFLSIIITLSLMKTYVIVPRYTLICLPFVIPVMASGVIAFKNRAFASTALVLLLVINLFFLVYAPGSAPKLGRIDRHGFLAKLLEELHLNENDIVIFPRYAGSVDKYISQNFKKYSMEDEFLKKNNVYSIIGKDAAEKITISNSTELFKKYFASKEYSSDFQKYVKDKFFAPLGKSGRFVLIANSNVTFYKPEMIEKIISDDELYKKSQIQFMLYSRINSDLFKLAMKDLALVDARGKRPWSVFVFTKRTGES